MRVGGGGGGEQEQTHTLSLSACAPLTRFFESLALFGLVSWPQSPRCIKTDLLSLPQFPSAPPGLTLIVFLAFFFFVSLLYHTVPSEVPVSSFHTHSRALTHIQCFFFLFRFHFIRLFNSFIKNNRISFFYNIENKFRTNPKQNGTRNNSKSFLFVSRSRF